MKLGFHALSKHRCSRGYYDIYFFKFPHRFHTQSPKFLKFERVQNVAALSSIGLTLYKV